MASFDVALPRATKVLPKVAIRLAARQQDAAALDENAKHRCAFARHRRADTRRQRQQQHCRLKAARRSRKLRDAWEWYCMRCEGRRLSIQSHNETKFQESSERLLTFEQQRQARVSQVNEQQRLAFESAQAQKLHQQELVECAVLPKHKAADRRLQQLQAEQRRRKVYRLQHHKAVAQRRAAYQRQREMEIIALVRQKLASLKLKQCLSGWATLVQKTHPKQPAAWQHAENHNPVHVHSAADCGSPGDSQHGPASQAALTALKVKSGRLSRIDSAKQTILGAARRN
ncbi:hypothetical protein WJX73_008310 [Symbiochloris irregularis]|uniref:Uncharacterized protein n=1 Tax=Symbiochloris irregularis TaxID=706552 RepID=A0AAW1PLU5_9CHLO